MPVRRGAVAVVCLSVLVIGCANTASSDQTATVPADATTIGSATSDPHPVITMGSSGADYWDPVDLAKVYVYPDGSVIRVSRQLPVSDGQRLIAQRFSLDQSHLDALVRAAVDAGLVGGGVQPAVRLPPGVRVADGGHVWISLRQGDSITTRLVDQPNVEAADATRAPFGPLTKALTDLCCAPRNDLVDVPLTRWVILATPTSATPRPEQQWTGPDITTLAWEKLDGSQCAIVNQTDWPLGDGERFVPFIVLDGKKVTRRPLLPHESTCADVVALLQQLSPVTAQRNSLP